MTVFAEPRTARAPLGNKTTNAKARPTHRTPGGKGLGRDRERTTIKPTTTLRPKHAAPQIEPSKLEVHTDKSPLDDEDIEYAPPKTKDLPYESDVFPDGVITFAGLKPENMFKGYYQYYFNPVDDDGKTSTEREMEEQQQRSFERGEEQIRKDMEEFDWSIGDVPESKDMFKKKKIDVATATAAAVGSKVARPAPRQPSTIASRKAASALAMSTRTPGTAPARPNNATAPGTTRLLSKGLLLPKRKPVQPVAQPSIAARERAAAVAASRSTLGYSRGRSTSSAVLGDNNVVNRQPQVAPKPRPLVRSVSTASTASDATITPTRFAQSELKNPDFLAIFDADDEDGNLGGGMPPMDDSDDDFQLTMNFS